MPKDGTSNPSLSRDTFGALLLPVPPFPEQQAIACILGALDDKIELNRRKNRTLEAMARAIFQSWFMDFDPVRAKAAGRAPAGLSPDLAAFFPDSFEDSTLGSIPKGWVARPLYEVATFINGAAFRSEDFCDPEEGLPVVKIAELKDGISGKPNTRSERQTRTNLLTPVICSTHGRAVLTLRLTPSCGPKGRGY